ncbi:MAG TPA: ATP-binding cassette domain-containing protein [Gemmatimonadales bacterium]|nr:ATP-binding cassette domain-containing protein [Gemmatimonadales bacterium]
MSGPVVSLQNITKRFAGHVAVRELSLDVPKGVIFGLLGPNGAGKSTTIRMIMDIIEPDEGRVVLFGGTATGRDLSHRIGFLPEERGLYKKMKVLDHLVFFGEVKGVPRRDARRKAEEWLDRLGLGDWTSHKVEDLSKGMQQKVQFAGTLLHDPELVILDEPFSGLDPVNSQVMKDVVVDLAREGRTVLFSTHIMEQAEKMCDRVVIISRGRKVVDGTMAEVKREGGGRHVALTFHRDAARASRVLADRSLVAQADDSGAAAELELATGADPDQLLRALVDSGAGISRFELVEPSLESIFIAKVGRDAAVAAAVEDNDHA